MNRKSSGLFLLLTIIACSPPAFGSLLTVAEQTTYSWPYPYGIDPPFDITSVGNLDWVVIDYSEKADSTAITTAGGGNTALMETSPWDSWAYQWGAPAFTWTDGFNGPSPDPVNGNNSGIVRANEPDDGARVGTHIAIPAGSGTITVWWVYALAGGTPTFTTTFDDGTTLEVTGGPDARKTLVNYSTDTDQTLAFGMNYNAGLLAIAVNTVPEPGTLILLGFGILGLPIYLLRRRK